VIRGRVAVLHLGSSGASPLFAKKTIDILESLGYETELINQAAFGKIGVFGRNKILRKLSKLFIFFKKGRDSYLQKIVISLQETSVDVVVLLFPHPWDLAFVKKTLIRNPEIRFIRILHDAKKHPGDIWPRKKWIDESMKVDAIVTLSSFVSNQIESSPVPIFTGAHPAFPELIQNQKDWEEFLPDLPYDLIAGRLKNYQNVFKTVRIWLKLYKNSHKLLVIVGRMNWYQKIYLKKDKKIVRITGTISDEMFQFLVRHATVSICLYKEASQSGVVAMAQTLGTPVLVSEAGALPEQISKYGGGAVIKHLQDLENLNFAQIGKANLSAMDFDFSKALSQALNLLI